MSLRVFLHGPLCHPPLLRAVLGADAATMPAELPDHAVLADAGGRFSLVEPAPGQVAGGLVASLTPDQSARLDAYMAGFACRPVALPLSDGQTAQVHLAAPGRWHAAGPFDPSAWAQPYAEAATATVADVLAAAARGDGPDRIGGRYAQMLVRGASRLRARTPGPTTLRRETHPGDVVVTRADQPYAGFFAVERMDLSFRRFDGSLGPMVERTVFVTTDAVTALPYDPGRDRVLLIEQFRPGPFVRGDVQCWSVEAIAGRIDPGETPEAAARREAMEEAGLTLGALHKVAGYYPTPAGKSEFLYSYVATCELPDGITGVHGVEGEAEDIRGHLVPFTRLMALIETGEITNAPLILTALWLALHRDRLRAT